MTERTGAIHDIGYRTTTARGSAGRTPGASLFVDRPARRLRARPLGAVQVMPFLLLAVMRRCRR